MLSSVQQKVGWYRCLILKHPIPWESWWFRMIFLVVENFFVKFLVSKIFKIKTPARRSTCGGLCSVRPWLVNCDDLTRCEKSPKNKDVPWKIWSISHSQYEIIHWSSKQAIFRGLFLFSERCVDWLSIHFLGGFHPGIYIRNFKKQLLTYQRGKNPPEGPIFRWFDLQHNRFSVDQNIWHMAYHCLQNW